MRIEGSVGETKRIVVPQPAAPPPLPVAAIASTPPVQNQSIQPLALPAGCEHHVFLSHDWGENGINHLFVKRVREKLRSVGISAWFDEELIDRAPDMQVAMSSGIDNSAIVLCFITLDYLEKVNQGDSRDNCCFEFGYAFQQKGSNGMVAVVVDDRSTDTRDWRGKVGGAIGNRLYVNMVLNHSNGVDDGFDNNFAKLHTRIRREVQRLL